MTTIYRKLPSAMLAGFLSFTFMGQAANAQCLPCFCIPKGFYAGIFGGWGSTDDNRATQTGTAFFPAAAGGPLAVHATGDIDGTNWLAGAHVGYEWRNCPFGNICWLKNLVPAIELEGYYLNITQEGDLLNPTPRLPEHDFVDNFPMNTGVFLVNGVFSYNIPCSCFTPYLGLGVGTAVTSIENARSIQIAPAEPGINHFNSRPNSSSWDFAAQLKTGLRYNLNNNFRVFAEYRLLYLSENSYTFGPTVYPTHVPTTSWNVRIGNQLYNMGVAGFEFSA